MDRLLTLVLATMVVAAGAARAHGIESSLARVQGLGSTLDLQSRFSSGEPAVGAAVTLVAPAGQTLALGHTDANGHLRFRLPPSANDSWELRVDQGPGHRDYLELPPLTTKPAAVVSRHGQGDTHQAVAWSGGGLLVLVGGLVLRPRRQEG